MRLVCLLCLLAACTPEAAPPPAAEISAMSVEGDFDGDGALDRAELWIKPTSSRLLIYLAANADNAILAHLSEGPADFLRIRSPEVLNRSEVQFDALSYGGATGEVLVYWDGAAFRALDLDQ